MQARSNATSQLVASTPSAPVIRPTPPETQLVPPRPSALATPPRPSPAPAPRRWVRDTPPETAPENAIQTVHEYRQAPGTSGWVGINAFSQPVPPMAPVPSPPPLDPGASDPVVRRAVVALSASMGNRRMSFQFAVRQPAHVQDSPAGAPPGGFLPGYGRGSSIVMLDEHGSVIASGTSIESLAESIVTRGSGRVDAASVPVSRVEMLARLSALQAFLRSIGDGIEADAPRGMTQDAIEKNTMTTQLTELPPASADDSQRQCMICLDDFKLGETVRTLPCFHRYHKGCVDNWLQRSCACPLCKHDVADTGEGEETSSSSAPPQVAQPDGAPPSSSAPTQVAEPNGAPPSSSAPTQVAEPNGIPPSSSAPTQVAEPDGAPSSSSAPTHVTEPHCAPEDAVLVSDVVEFHSDEEDEEE